MTFSWYVRDRYVVGTSAGDETTQRFDLNWGADPALSEFPWSPVNYPDLLIVSLGFTYTTNAAAAARRPRITLTQPGSGAQTIWVSGTTTTAANTRRYQFAAAVALDNVLAPGQHIKDPLPEDLILQAGQTTGVVGTLAITIDNFVLGDTFSAPLTLTGYLLY